MSGGYWDYIQHRFTDVIEDIKSLIDKNGKKKTEEELKNSLYDKTWFEKYPADMYHRKYDDKVIAKFNEAIETIKKAQIYIQEIDWLLSGDTGEESFLQRIKDAMGEKIDDNLDEKDKDMFIAMVASTTPSMAEADAYTKIGLMYFSGNQWNENWSWRISELNKLSIAELINLYNKHKK